MTWRELFRRAWLVLRLRFKRFHVCEECGDIEEPREAGSLAGVCTFWTCPTCEEFARLEREKAIRESPTYNLLPWEAAREESVRQAARQITALDLFNRATQNQATGLVDHAALQNQMGVPIRVPSKSALNAIGSAISFVWGSNPLP